MHSTLGKCIRLWVNAFDFGVNAFDFGVNGNVWDTISLSCFPLDITKERKTTHFLAVHGWAVNLIRKHTLGPPDLLVEKRHF